jgi:hypothetical protein
MKIKPEEARINARLRRYNNSEEERAAIRAVDDAVFDKVRYVEQMTVDNATRFLSASQQHLFDAAALAEDLQGLRNDLDYTDRVAPGTTGERYAILHARYDEVNKKLDDIDRESEWIERKAADPYAHYLDMTERFAMLRPDLP